MTVSDPYHEGERYVQEQAGVRDVALRLAGMVGDTIPSRAMPFLAQQRLLAMGTVDAEGTVSASVILGARGFVSSPDGRSVLIDRSRVRTSGDDVAWTNLRRGADVGLLAIELETRRRLHINGTVSDSHARHVAIDVREAYPNCPKYIQRRHLRIADDDVPNDSTTRGWQPHTAGVELDAIRSAMVASADTFFVASRHATRGVDVSHRGGSPGFVRVLEPTRLRIPDYPGNSMFNTLGNLATDGRAGLLFMDFERGRFVHLTGVADVRVDPREDPHQPTGGAGRYWDFRITSWRETAVGLPVAWELLDYSPHNPIAPE